MTIENAIAVFEGIDELEGISMFYQRGGKADGLMLSDIKESCRMAISALRAQRAPAKLDRSRWEGCPACEEEVFVKRRQYMRPAMAPLTPEQALMDKLADLTGIVYVEVKNKFCPVCGRPLTEEALAELERRINGG